MINNSVKLTKYEIINTSYSLLLTFSFPLDPDTIIENIKIFNPITENYIPYTYTMNKEIITLNFIKDDITPNNPYTLLINDGITDVFKRHIAETVKVNFSFTNQLISDFIITKPIRNEIYDTAITVMWQDNTTAEIIESKNNTLRITLEDSGIYLTLEELETAYESMKYYITENTRVQLSDDPFFTNKIYDEYIVASQGVQLDLLEEYNKQLFVRVRPEETEDGNIQTWSNPVSFIHGEIESELPTYIDETIDTSLMPPEEVILEGWEDLNLLKYISDDVVDKIIFRFDRIIDDSQILLKIETTDMFEEEIPYTLEVKNKDIIITFEEEIALEYRNKSINVFLLHVVDISHSYIYTKELPLQVSFIKYPYFVDIEDVLSLIRDTEPNLKDVSYNIRNSSELAIATFDEIEIDDPSYLVKQYVRYSAAYDSLLSIYISKSSASGTTGKIGDVQYGISNKIDLSPMLDELKDKIWSFKKAIDGDATISGVMSAVKSGKCRPQFTDLNLGFNRGHDGNNMFEKQTSQLPLSYNGRWRQI